LGEHRDVEPDEMIGRANTMQSRGKRAFLQDREKGTDLAGSSDSKKNISSRQKEATLTVRQKKPRTREES